MSWSAGTPNAIKHKFASDEQLIWGNVSLRICWTELEKKDVASGTKRILAPR